MENQSRPLVSVVTPVYNGAKHLAECIESVLNQTYTRWEYVIVNNRSSDSSLEIAEAYARKDARIRIHNNETFLTIIDNHNVGFQQIAAASRYVKMVHADDWLYPECLAEMLGLAEAHPRVGIVSSYRLDDRQVTLSGLPYQSQVVTGKDLCGATLKGEYYVFGSPSSLLIRSDCIRSIVPFYDGANFPMHCDTAACYEVLKDWEFGFVHQVLTYTRRHAEANTSRAQRLNTYAAENLRMLKRYGPAFLDAVEYDKCLEQKLDHYMRFLGQSVFVGRDRQFWAYHRKILEEMGQSPTSLVILKAAAREARAALLMPAVKVGRALRVLLGRS